MEICLKYANLLLDEENSLRKGTQGKYPLASISGNSLPLHWKAAQGTCQSYYTLSTIQGLFGLGQAWRDSAPSSECFLIVAPIIVVIRALSLRNALGCQ